METSDLLVALLSDGITFNRTGADGIKRFKFISSLKQRLAFLNRLLPLNDIIKLIKLMFREGKLLDGGYMMEDPSNPPEGDSAWFIIAVDDVDSIEFVYLLYRYRFAPETSE